MANHEIPNQALCKYKGDVTSFDVIPNFNNKALQVVSSHNDTRITWVNFSLKGQQIPTEVAKVRIHCSTFKKSMFLGLYFSLKENEGYNSNNTIARLDFDSYASEGDYHWEQKKDLTYENYPMLGMCKSIGIVTNHQTSSSIPKYRKPKFSISKIEFLDSKDKVLLSISPCEAALNAKFYNASGFVDENNSKIVYQNEAEANENKLKLSKGDIYTRYGKGYIWDGNDWKYLGKNPDLSKYQSIEDDALNTEDKTIVGAINEIQTNAFGRINLLEQFKQDKISVIEESGLRLGEEGTVLSINVPYLIDTLPFYQQVDSLDEITEYSDKIIYLVKNPYGTGNNQYNAYVYIKEGVETPYFELLSGDSSNISLNQLLYVQKYATPLTNGQYTITTENISNIKHSIVLRAGVGTTITAQGQSWVIDTTNEVLIDNLDTTYPITFTSYSPFSIQYAIDTEFIATQDYVNSVLSTTLTREIKDRSILDNVSPSYDEYPSNIIYMLPSENEDGTYDEYMNVDNKWEQIGSTKIDLSGYVPVEAWESHLEEYETLKTRIIALEQSQGTIDEVLEDVY